MRDLQLELKYWEYHRHDDRVVLPVHAHRFWQLNLAEAGHTLIHIGGEKPFRLEAGEFLFVPPGIPHKLEFDRRIPFVGFSFKFELHELEGENAEVLHIPASPETRGILRELFPAGEGFSGENPEPSARHRSATEGTGAHVRRH